MTDLLTAVAESPLAAVLCALAILVVGIAAGYIARRNEEHDQLQHSAPMRTANSSLVDLTARRALKDAGVMPRARAGCSHLKPSYDSRAHTAAAAPRSPESTRG